MTRPPPITRRRLGHLLASLFATIVSTAKGEEPETPTQIENPHLRTKEKSARDRGIGGTGVIGTIRGFGSIVVNNLHVSYSEGVPVTIDGQRSKVSSLRLGQLVQVVAYGDRDQLVASHIEVTSEVVGPVQFFDGSNLLVLGQRIQTASSFHTPNIRIGEVVAVFGLRRLDSVIIATRIERRPGAKLHVTGPLSIDATGRQYIGSLQVKIVNSGWKGTRIVVKGHLVDNVFNVSSSWQDLLLLTDRKISRVMLESYVSTSSSRITFGFGFQLPAGRARVGVRELEGQAVVSTLDRKAGGELLLNSASIDSAGPFPGASAPPPPKGSRQQIPGNQQSPNPPNGTSPPGGGSTPGDPSRSNGPQSNH